MIKLKNMKTTIIFRFQLILRGAARFMRRDLCGAILSNFKFNGSTYQSSKTKFRNFPGLFREQWADTYRIYPGKLTHENISEKGNCVN